MTEPNADQIPEPKPEGGTPAADDTSGLKKALEAERIRARELEKQLKAREKAEEDARTAKEREEMEKRGEFEKLRAQDQAKLKEAQDKIDGLLQKDRKAAITRAAFDAISAHDGIPKALEPHLLGALEAVQDGDGYKVVVAADPSKDAAALVAGWRKDPEWAWAFKGTGASGAGTLPGGKALSGKTLPHSKFLTLTPKERTAFMQSGGALTEG